MTRPSDLFDLTRLDPALRELVDQPRPWDVLAAMDRHLNALPNEVTVEEGATVHPTAILEGAVTVRAGAIIEAHAHVRGPALIEAGATVGHAALVRDGCILAAGAKVGHASEAKRSLLLPGAKAPHFNYVGDSILGTDVNLGAGVKIANLKNDGSTIHVGPVDTHLRKFGAALGDDVHVGCNAVLGPGAVIGARTLIYAGATVRGDVPADHIVKHRAVGEIVERLPGGPPGT